MRIISVSNLEHILVRPNGKKLLTTLNADIYRIVRCTTELRDIVFRNHVCIDGRPLHAFAKLYAGHAELVQGSTLIYNVARFSGECGGAILVMGGRNQVNADAVSRLMREHDCEVYGYAPEHVDIAALREACKLIVQHDIKFVFVCLGAPRQEIAAAQMMDMLPDTFSVLFIGAGGSVDFAAGTLKRAPRIIQGLFLEGAYRLFKEPSYKRVRRLITSMWGVGLFYFDAITKKIVICSRQ